jgi:hypothetical protein
MTVPRYPNRRCQHRQSSRRVDIRELDPHSGTSSAAAVRQRVGKGMGGRPAHPAKTFSEFSGRRLSADQPVAPIGGRPEHGIACRARQGERRGGDVGRRRAAGMSLPTITDRARRQRQCNTALHPRAEIAPALPDAGSQVRRPDRAWAALCPGVTASRLYASAGPTLAGGSGAPAWPDRSALPPPPICRAEPRLDRTGHRHLSTISTR